MEFATNEEGQQILTDESTQHPLNDGAGPRGLTFSVLTPTVGTLDLGEDSNGDAAIKVLQQGSLL